jgi:hypothetical protein
MLGLALHVSLAQDAEGVTLANLNTTSLGVIYHCELHVDERHLRVAAISQRLHLNCEVESPF